jgi:hypothetical protein
VLQVAPRLYAGSANTWAFQTFVNAPPAYTATFQSFRGLCGTITSVTTDDLLDFFGTVQGTTTSFVTAMKIPNGESLFVGALTATSASFGTPGAPAILTTARAFNSPAYPTFTGTVVTSSITSYTALYSPPDSAQPSASVSTPNGASTACTQLTNGTISTLCTNAGFTQFSALQSFCGFDAAQISVAQASASTYNTLVNVCTAFAVRAGSSLDPTNAQNICPTLCFLQGRCVADDSCTCNTNYDQRDCSRQTNLGPFTEFISPTNGTGGTFVRVHGSQLYMDAPVTPLNCRFGTRTVNVTSVTEFDLTCTAPSGPSGRQAFQIVRSGVTAQASNVNFTYPTPPATLFFGDKYTAASCAAVTLFPPVNSFRDCALWQSSFIDVGKVVTLGPTPYCCARRGVYESGLPDFCQRANCLGGDTDQSVDCMASNGQIGSPCFQYCINISPVLDPDAANASANAVEIYNGAVYVPPVNATTLTPFVPRNVYLVLADDSLDVGWKVTVVSPAATVGCRVNGVRNLANTTCSFGCANAATLPMSSCIRAPNQGCYCLCQDRGTGVFPS